MFGNLFSLMQYFLLIEILFFQRTTEKIRRKNKKKYYSFLLLLLLDEPEQNKNIHIYQSNIFIPIAIINVIIIESDTFEMKPTRKFAKHTHAHLRLNILLNLKY